MGFQRSSYARTSSANPLSSANPGRSNPIDPIPDGNPDPKNWKLIRYHENSKFLVIQLKYPDCTNYEGNKILAFESISLADLINGRWIDPHFFEESNLAIDGKKIKSPIARFEPTDRGWLMAIQFVGLWANQEREKGKR